MKTKEKCKIKIERNIFGMPKRVEASKECTTQQLGIVLRKRNINLKKLNIVSFCD